MNNNPAFQVVLDKDLGEIKIFRKSGTRNMRILIKPFNQTHLYIPDFITPERANRFLEEKKQWIRKNRLKIVEREKKISFFTEENSFSTKAHQLIITRHPRSVIRTVIGKGRIQVQIPDFADMQDGKIQATIRKSVLAAWKLEAQRFLPAKVKSLAAKNHMNYGRITVRNNKTRWGSCSGDNHISLNIHLMRLPEHLCEYVILHELCHTKHKHHQKSFWQHLDQITNGMAKQLDRELNLYSPEIW